MIRYRITGTKKGVAGNIPAIILWLIALAVPTPGTAQAPHARAQKKMPLLAYSQKQEPLQVVPSSDTSSTGTIFNKFSLPETVEELVDFWRAGKIPEYTPSEIEVEAYKRATNAAGRKAYLEHFGPEEDAIFYKERRYDAIEQKRWNNRMFAIVSLFILLISVVILLRAVRKRGPKRVPQPPTEHPLLIAYREKWDTTIAVKGYIDGICLFLRDMEEELDMNVPELKAFKAIYTGKAQKYINAEIERIKTTDNMEQARGWLEQYPMLYFAKDLKTWLGEREQKKQASDLEHALKTRFQTICQPDAPVADAVAFWRDCKTHAERSDASDEARRLNGRFLSKAEKWIHDNAIERIKQNEELNTAEQLISQYPDLFFTPELETWLGEEVSRYAALPHSDGYFSKAGLLRSPDGDTLFEIRLKGRLATEAELWLYPNPRPLEELLHQLEWVEKVCDTKHIVFVNGARPILGTKRPGKLKLEDRRWKIMEDQQKLVIEVLKDHE